MKIEIAAKIEVWLNNGATTRLLDFSEDLARRHQVRLWLQRGPLPPVLTETSGLRVRLLPAPTPRHRPDAVKAIRAAWYEIAFAAQLAFDFIRHGRADAIYLREVATVAPTLIGALFRVPVFIELDGFPYGGARRRGGPFQRIRAALFKLQGRRSAGIVVFSEVQGELAVQSYGVGREKVLALPNGADILRFRPASRAEALEALGLDPARHYVLWAGSLRGNQDVPKLLCAFGLLKAREHDAGLVLLAPDEAALKQAAREAGIEDDAIIRHVPHDEVPRWAAAATVCVATMADTPFMRAAGAAPLKLFEYLACGRPAVVPDFSYLNFVAAEGLGLSYAVGDAASLAEALDKLLSQPEDQLDEIGARARAYVEAHHDWSRINLRTEEFIRERIQASRR